MKTIVVRIEATRDSYSAWAENCQGVTAHADTVEEVKKQILESIELNKTLNANPPAILKGNIRLFTSLILNKGKGYLRSRYMLALRPIYALFTACLPHARTW